MIIRDREMSPQATKMLFLLKKALRAYIKLQMHAIVNNNLLKSNTVTPAETDVLNSCALTSRGSVTVSSEEEKEDVQLEINMFKLKNRIVGKIWAAIKSKYFRKRYEELCMQ